MKVQIKSEYHQEVNSSGFGKSTQSIPMTQGKQQNKSDRMTTPSTQTPQAITEDHGLVNWKNSVSKMDNIQKQDELIKIDQAKEKLLARQGSAKKIPFYKLMAEYEEKTEFLKSVSEKTMD